MLRLLLAWGWTLSAALLTGVSWWALRHARRDRCSVRLARVRNGRRLIAHAAVRRQQVRRAVGAAWTAAGLLALLASGTAWTVGVAPLLAVGAVLLTVDAVADARLSRRLHERVTEQTDAAGR